MEKNLDFSFTLTDTFPWLETFGNAIGLENHNEFFSALIALITYTSTYIAEAIRGGIQSLPKGQTEAGKTLGMNYFQTMHYIVLPQAIKIVWGPITGQFLNLVKNSSLAMTIGVASEYTILIMERYQEEKETGEDMFTAIQTSIQKIGTAISVSGLTTAFGFSALILSTSPVIQNFGTITVLTVGFSLIGAIVVMPAVISLFERYTGDAPRPEKQADVPD